MSFEEIAKGNEQSLKENAYPGRGIITGMSPDGRNYYQVYWLMGRSENSRNRIFEQEDGFVKTSPFDNSHVLYPSLIIYYPIKNSAHIHIVSNGDHTETLYNAIRNGKSVENALYDRSFEPDSPHFTPRISGIVNAEDKNGGYMLSILKAENNCEDYCNRFMFHYEKSMPGYGHCLHTYHKDGNPLPSFSGEPYLVRLSDDAEEVLEYYWSLLNNENRISILVKKINRVSNDFTLTIKNKLNKI